MSGVESKALLALLKASLPKVGSVLKEWKEDFDHYCEHRFMPYIIRNYNLLDLSTSQLFRNENYKISELYIPLTVKEIGTDNKFYCINKFPKDLFQSNNKVLINDNAGVGKSTVLKMMFRYAIDESLEVPFYIDMKSLIKGDELISIEDYIIESFPSFKNIPSKDFLHRHLDDGTYLFLFDGADEVPDKVKEPVYREVNRFCAAVSNSKFVIATRDEDIILSAFNEFKSHSINPLKKHEAYALLKKYEFKDVKADELIYEIEKDENSGILEFLANPLLTTLLYTAYVYKRKIPLKKSLFFHQIYNSLYENHDATKIGFLTREKKSGLDIDGFEKIVSHLAYLSRLSEQLEYSDSEIYKILSEIATKHPTIKFDVRGLINDLFSRVPILRKDGLVYSWQHKSIQEYFFVRFLDNSLSDKNQKIILKQLISSKNSQKYKLVLDILFDENETLFHDVITRSVIEEIIKGGVGIDETDSMSSINILYKFISGDEEFVLGEKSEEMLRDHLGSSQFDNISEFLSRKFNLNSYNPSFMSITHSKKVTLSFVFELPQTVVLEVLFGKKVGLVSIVSTNEDEVQKNIRYPMNISNISPTQPIEEFSKLDFHKNYYVLDIAKAKQFMSEFTKKKDELEALMLDFEI